MNIKDNEIRNVPEGEFNSHPIGWPSAARSLEEAWSNTIKQPEPSEVKTNDLDFTYHDFSEISENEKKKLIKEFSELTAFHALKLFRSLGLQSHIECMVVDQTTGDEFILSFKKLINGKLPINSGSRRTNNE